MTVILVLLAAGVLIWLVLYMRAQKSDTSIQKLIQAGSWLEAIAEADRVIAKNPRDTAALLHRAEAAKLRGAWEEAIRSYRAILLIDRTDPAAREGLALALAHAGHDFGEARTLMEETIQMFPGIQEFQALSLAFILLRAGERDEALRIFADHAELIETRFELDYTDPDPLLAETLYCYAVLAKESGDTERATRLAAQVARYAPGSSFARL